MRKRTAVAFILALSMLTGCNSNEKTLETKDTIEETDNTTVATETETEPEPEPTDDLVSEPMGINFARDVHESGSIKDGVYLASGLVFDEDNSGLTADIYEYVSLDEKDCSNMSLCYFVNFENCCHGDFYGSLDKPEVITTYNTRFGGITDSTTEELNSEGWFLKKQADGSYYVFDQDEEPLVYPYEEQMSLGVVENPVIYGYADVFSDEGIKTTDLSYKFDDLQLLIDRMDYVTETGHAFNAHIVVKDGMVSEIYVAPIEVSGDLFFAHSTEFANGNIPDGDYCVDSYSFDSDFKGMTVDLRDYPYYTKDEVDQMKKGDLLVLPASTDEYDFITGEQSLYDIVQITEEPIIGDQYVSIGNDYDLALQPDGQYYLMWNGMVSSAPVMEREKHIDVSDPLVIMDNADVYCSDGINTDEYTITFDDLESFRDAVEDDSAWYVPSIHVIIKDGKISEIYINPDQHQPWRD